MAGAIGERDRDRGPRGDAGAATSLWIDYVLLPEKLEEHLVALAAGQVASPTPPDLITMFLEQALLNHKGSPGSSSALLSKDGGLPPGAFTIMGKTAVLLCERAARVAVAAGLSLLDIEASISSYQHQNLLLKALVKYDEDQLLIHECNFHRWVLRNALQSHPLGSAAPNATLSGPRPAVGSVGEDLSGQPKTPDNGGILVSKFQNVSSRAGEVQIEEERHSVEFLEKVLTHEDGSCATDCVTPDGHGMTNEVNVEALTASQGDDHCHSNQSPVNIVMSTKYRCQIMLDVAEVHFMRGRIHRAHELFTMCAELAKSKQQTDETDRAPCKGFIPELQRLHSLSIVHVAASVPAERLAGFIVACRMLLGTHMKLSAPEDSSNESLKEIGLGSSPVLGLAKPYASQRMVIACEQTRYNIKQRFERAQTLVLKSPTEDDLPIEPPNKKLKVSLDEQKDEQVEPQESQGELEPRTQDCTNLKATDLIDSKHEGKEEICGASSMKPVGPELGVAGGVQSTSLNETSSIKSGADVSGWLLTADPVLKEIFEDGVQVGEIEEGSRAGESASRRLLQLMVHDTLEGHLLWGYRISLARDPHIPLSLRCQLVACNAVRHIVEKAPLQLFLEDSDIFRNNVEGGKFLFNLMRAVKESSAAMPKAKDNGSVVGVKGTGWVQPGRGSRVKTEGYSRVDNETLSTRICLYAFYFCCVLDKPWCWEAAVENKVISPAVIPRFFAVEPLSISLKKFIPKSIDIIKKRVSSSIVEEEEVTVKALGSPEDLRVSGSGCKFLRVSQLMSIEAVDEKTGARAFVKLEEILCDLLDAENIGKIESLVVEADALVKASIKEPGDEPQKITDISSSDYRIAGSKSDKMTNSIAYTSKWDTFQLDVAALLRRRAFNALDSGNQLMVAKTLHELARAIHPKDHDSMVMLWLLNKVSPEQGVVRRLSSLEELDGGVVLDLGSIEYIINCLIEKELWTDLSELCLWGLSLVSGEHNNEAEGVLDGVSKGQDIGCRIQHRRLGQIMKVATTLGELMPLCSALLSATGCNRYTEDEAHMSTRISQLFEDFLRLLVGADVEGFSKNAEDKNQYRGAQSSQVAPSPGYPGAQAVPLIPQLTNSRVLMNLAMLTAGWLQRCNLAGHTSWPLPIERYGALGAVTSGVSLPPPAGSLPHAAAVFRPMPPKVAPEFGRDLFGVLLECIVSLPGVVEGDEEKGHRWLQGLADLAYEDEAYVKALQLYLQAGGIRSAYYCDRSLAMPRDIFTPWVLQRMVHSCRQIGATVQAAVLCQCFPQPDLESAFRYLQENYLIVVRDAVAYFDCIWEVPILELLVHMHSKSGDQERVSALITLLQQPALNVHNPQSIRLAHVASLEQRFLQRLCGELL